MDQDYETDVVDFLSRKENIRVALEIGERIGQVKMKLAMDFWTTLYELLSEFLNNASGSFANWEVRFDEKLKESPTYELAGVSIVPRIRTEQNMYLYPSMNVKGFQIFFGVCWSQEVKQDFPMQDLENLADSLKKGGYNNRDSLWLGRNWTSCSLREKDFLIRMADNKQPAIDAAGQLTGLFSGFYLDIEKVNRALAQASTPQTRENDA
jgi:hypothetical protein